MERRGCGVRYICPSCGPRSHLFRDRPRVDGYTRATVVFQSLWGNTAAVGRAIAEGLGPQTVVGHTGEITPEQAAESALLVVGAPVHAMTLPTAQTLSGVASRPVGPGDLPPEVDQPLLRDWIAHLPDARLPYVAFDTRVPGFVGRGGASTIERLLTAKGYRIAAKSEGFLVINRRAVHEAASMLREGELRRALEWGTHLAALL